MHSQQLTVCTALESRNFPQPPPPPSNNKPIPKVLKQVLFLQDSKTGLKAGYSDQVNGHLIDLPIILSDKW